MYKKVTGIYEIKCNFDGAVYYGSAVCTTGRLNQHRRELRNNIHTNVNIQKRYDIHGLDGFTFSVIELCDRENLRVREQYYINNAKTELMNMDLFVCDLAPAEEHSKRMKGAWAKRTPEQKAAIAKKISDTLKARYKAEPELLKSARDSLAKGRASDNMKKNKHSDKAKLKRTAAIKKGHANQSKERKKEISDNARKKVLENSTPEERSKKSSDAANKLWENMDYIQRQEFLLKRKTAKAVKK